jgi:diguanylate cyclase (GGDEF)-like protein
MITRSAARGLASARAFLAVPADDPELARSQIAAFSTQLPLLYVILVANAGLLSATHWHTAPVLLTVFLPGALGLFCMSRAYFWWRHDARTISAEMAIDKLRTTVRLVPFLGLGFAAWALSLFPYGDAYAQCHVAFYMAITVITCIFCLMNLRSAALMLTFFVVLPFTLFFGLSGQPVLVAIACNLVLVTIGMTYILQRNYHDFAALVVSQRELLLRQAETQRLSDENDRLANLDSLTQLPNRRRFLADLDRALDRARKAQSRLALTLIDLDGFKGVNDLHGHAAGDLLLKEVGERLLAIAGPDISVARLGGDEFGVIVSGNPDADAIVRFGNMLCARLRGPYLLPDIEADVCGSAGLAAFPADGDNAKALFERADYALYTAKEKRIGQAVIFSPDHEAVIRRAGLVDHALRHADFSREFWLAYQPIVEAGSLRTLGFEALARWSCPGYGHVGPDVFVPAAERLRLIGKLSEALLRTALAAAKTLPPTLRIAFNLSAQDVTSPETVSALRRIILQSGLAPDRIDLEITETAVMRDFALAQDSLALLRQTGVRITLDDFGTGFSSLSHVHRLKPDKIKIDRSFVADIHTSQMARDIVRTVVDLCDTLRLDCVMEGVETEAQMRVLASLGCRMMQGYLFSRPMPQADLVSYLARTEVPDRHATAV